MPTQANDQELAKARLHHRLSVVIAVLAVALLVVAFGLQWKGWTYAVIVFAAWIAVEWQRSHARRVKVPSDPFAEK